MHQQERIQFLVSKKKRKSKLYRLVRARGASVRPRSSLQPRPRRPPEMSSSVKAPFSPCKFPAFVWSGQVTEQSQPQRVLLLTLSTSRSELLFHLLLFVFQHNFFFLGENARLRESKTSSGSCNRDNTNALVSSFSPLGMDQVSFLAALQQKEKNYRGFCQSGQQRGRGGHERDGQRRPALCSVPMCAYGNDPEPVGASKVVLLVIRVEAPLSRPRPERGRDRLDDTSTEAARP